MPGTGARPLRDPSDEILAARARRGSLASFEQLVLRYESRLRDFLIRRGAGEHDAEDLVQDAFLRAWDKLDLYDPERPFATWMFTLTSRLAIGASRRRRPVLLEPSLWPAESERAGASADPAQEVADADQGRRLWEVADRELPEEQRSLLWLRYAEGLEIADLAEISGRTTGAVRVALHRARQRLAACLEDGPITEAQR